MMEKMMEKLVASQENSESCFQEVEKQVSQLAQMVGRLESRGKLPSQTENNRRANVSDITLRSGTVVEPKAREKEAEKGEEEEPLPTKQDAEGPNASSSVVQPPFPSRLVNQDKQAKEKSILDIFRKVEVNIPLLEVIKRVPRYARFLKDLCTSKRKLTGYEKVNLGEHVSAVFQQKLPPKMKDQGMFAIPCKIGKVKIKCAMCDLGASINVMPLSIYKMIANEPLKDTKVKIQLADRSVINPEGLLENVLVEVDKLIFPADFYIINMENDQSNTSSDILLGRPFLSTANTEIEVRSGLLTMEFDGEKVKFDVYKPMEHPSSMPNVNCVNTFEPSVDKHDSSDKLYRNLNVETVKEREMDITSNVDSRPSCKELSENLNFMLCQSKKFSSISQVPNLDIKLSPDKLFNKDDILPENTKDLHDHKVSQKEVLSWTKRKKWREYFSQCL
ncbi:hypothetical protein GQ457_01G017260 [Hibiscus cannabinus]